MRAPDMPCLNSVNTVLRALGARPVEAAARYEVHRQDVNNWKRRGRIPSRFYLVMQRDLAAIGKTANPKLWGISKPNGK